MRIVEPQKSQKSKNALVIFKKRLSILKEHLSFMKICCFQLQPKDLHSPPLEGCQISDLTG
jgi:hypothetical protein